MIRLIKEEMEVLQRHLERETPNFNFIAIHAATLLEFARQGLHDQAKTAPDTQTSTHV